LNCILNIFAQEIGLDPAKERRFNRGISITLNDNSPVFATTMSRITNLSNDPRNNRNFGRYVQMVYYFQENGKAIEVNVIYSNLKTINVEIGDVVRSVDIVGYSGGSGTTIHRNNNYIYIYTIEDCINLRRLTNDTFIYEDETFWWDPSFLFSQ